MDKKYNESWVVIIGEGFGFEVTHEVKHVLWMYFGQVPFLCTKPERGKLVLERHGVFYGTSIAPLRRAVRFSRRRHAGFRVREPYACRLLMRLLVPRAHSSVM